MTEQSIQKIIRKTYVSTLKNRGQGHKVCISNVYLYEWESDLITITRSNSIWEFEVKIRKYDYLKDFDKSEKHNALNTMSDLTAIPNRFWYVCPEDMIAQEDMPNYAGLMYVCKSGMNKYLRTIKKAPQLHNERNLDWEKIAMKLFNKLQ